MLISEFVETVSAWFSADWKSQDGIIRPLVFPGFTALFAAFFGAMMAAILNRRAEIETYRREELKRTYFAASIAAAACNSALGMKKQNVKSLFEKYHAERARVVQILAIPTVRKTIITQYDLQTLQPQDLLTESLAEAVSRIYERQALDVGMVIAAKGAAKELNNLLSSRNAWIDRFREQGAEWSEEYKVQIYFGLTQKDLHVDTSYKDSIDGIYNLLDDFIFFSFQIYGSLLHQVYRKKRKVGRRFANDHNIAFMDFSDARRAGLFPDSKNYADWVRPIIRRKKPWYLTRGMHEANLLRELFNDTSYLGR